MKLYVYGIYDKNAKTYEVFLMRNNAEALRAFINATKDEKNNIHKFADDFELHVLGCVNTETGEVFPCEKKILGEAKNFVVKTETK